MRKVAVMAGIVAALLTIVGCGVSNGPSKADVASVDQALGALPAGWTLTYVEGDSSSSEGISRDLSVGLEVASTPTVTDLRDVLERIVAALPSGARYFVSISIRTPDLESRFTDLSSELRELGLADTAGDHKVGDIFATRGELAKGLEATS